MCNAGDIVWVVDGAERPFEPLPEEARRPWLEEAGSWGAPAPRAEEPRDEREPAPAALVWV